jgi:hypothetical protein
MRSERKPSVFERARQGEKEAFEEILSSVVAPTFDTALHLFGDPECARKGTEDALFALLESVQSGAFAGSEPLAFLGGRLAAAARERNAVPLTGMMAGESFQGRVVPALSVEEGTAIILELSLGLTLGELADAMRLDRPTAALVLARAHGALDTQDPAEAWQELLDARAAAVRLPSGIADRVLDRMGLSEEDHTL